MPEPTSRLTAYDLVLKVACAAEIASYGVTGNEPAQIPTDPDDLDRCLKVVNDAIRDFISHAPVGGWRWRNRLMEVKLDPTGEAAGTLCIDKDPTRYLLPQDFQGETAGEITFAADSSACGIEWTSEADIRARREIATRTRDAPFVAAILPNSTQRRWELVVDPAPTSVHTIVFSYKANFDRLTLVAGTATAGGNTSLTNSALIGLYPTDYFKGRTIRIISGTGRTSYAVCTGYDGSTGAFAVVDWLYKNGVGGGTNPGSGSIYYVDAGEVHPCGMQFDAAVVSACLAQCEQEFTDVNRGYMEKFLAVDLPTAHAIDGRSAPRKFGKAKQMLFAYRGLVTYGARA